MTKINNQFDIRQEVYLISDFDQFSRMVVYFTVYDKGDLMYGLSCNGEVTEHYEFEITDSKRVI
jgi:hypothetical protein